VRVGVVDVGANTVRLLVTSREKDALVSIREERVQLGLGEEIEQSGRIGDEKLAEAAATAAGQVRKARKLGCPRVEVLVTSPGRQAENGTELVASIADATGVAAHVLSVEEEGELAWRGALAAAGGVRGPVAVCDVGGGSTQIAVGDGSSAPPSITSIDIGSLRLTRRAFRNDPPDAEDVARAARAVAERFAGIAPAAVESAIAVGGSAQSLRRVVGDELTEETLLFAVGRLSKRFSKKIAKEYGVDDARARTMTAGAMIFLDLQRRLGVPLRVGRGGLREGAALRLLEIGAAERRSA
jgi:exopolyphosphatase/guanosine-5'-triphosphate,3'-diphosphate pyrophosphatase